MTLTVVDHGPGHWPGSAVPGQLGNAVFAGHRVTHSHPFRNVDKLVPGDEIIFVMPNGTFTYRMTKQQIVNPTDTWIVNPTQTRRSRCSPATRRGRRPSGSSSARCSRPAQLDLNHTKTACADTRRGRELRGAPGLVRCVSAGYFVKPMSS